VDDEGRTGTGRQHQLHRPILGRGCAALQRRHRPHRGRRQGQGQQHPVQQRPGRQRRGRQRRLGPAASAAAAA